MRKDILKQIIADFHRASLPPSIHRQLDVPMGTGKIITIVGVRRSGKTYYLYQMMKQLLDEGLPKRDLVYINFEDERLDLKKEELDLILQAYNELYPDASLEKVHFFFDEFQNIGGWEQFTRRIHETISKNIYITGSNSKLLSKDISTTLRGRALPYEMYPLNFREYLNFNGTAADDFSSAGRAAIRNHFSSFLKYGGFPELVDLEKNLYDKILQEYYNTMLFKDMVERYEIKQIHVLKYFLKRLFASISKDVSVNKIYHELKSQGIKVGKNILYEFMEATESIYLMSVLQKFNPSVLKQEMSEKKIYCIDNGLINAVTYRFSNDTGILLENLVACELLKKGKQTFFYREKVECDFIITRKDEICSAIQVSLSISEPDTRLREIRGLLAACKRFGLKQGTILTNDEKEIFKEQDIEVKVIPAFEYCLS